MWRGPKTTPSTWGFPLSGHSFPEAYWLPSFLHPFPSYSPTFISRPSLVWHTEYVTAHLCPEKTSQKQPQRLLLWVQNHYKLLSPACASHVDLIRENRPFAAFPWSAFSNILRATVSSQHFFTDGEFQLNCFWTELYWHQQVRVLPGTVCTTSHPIPHNIYLKENPPTMHRDTSNCIWKKTELRHVNKEVPSQVKQQQPAKTTCKTMGKTACTHIMKSNARQEL